MRPLAFVDVETTGLDPARHELLEIAVVRVDPRKLVVLEETDVRVQPTNLADADPESLRVNGYTPDSWDGALPLAEALDRVAPVLDGAILAGHNVGFDRAFLEAAWRSTGRSAPSLDYHVLDTVTLAWPLLRAAQIDSLSLSAVAAHLGLERARPHRALADARCALDVARRLLPEHEDAVRLACLAGDERSIARLSLHRLHIGRDTYGPWRVGADGRSYPREALAEVLDAVHYCAAELVRLERQSVARPHRPRVYVCHPFGDDPEGNAAAVRRLCRILTDTGVVPVAPQLYLPQFVDERTERERALDLCLELLDACDEVRVYGGTVTAGMRAELARAEAKGIPVRFADAAESR